MCLADQFDHLGGLAGRLADKDLPAEFFKKLSHDFRRKSSILKRSKFDVLGSNAAQGKNAGEADVEARLLGGCDDFGACTGEQELVPDGLAGSRKCVHCPKQGVDNEYLFHCMKDFSVKR